MREVLTLAGSSDENPGRGIGREAAELMFSRMDAYDGPPRPVTLPTPLVERGSGEIPPP